MIVTVDIRLLGEFELSAQGREAIMVTARKARALLAYLSLKAGRPQQRDTLARLLWGEVSQEEHARKSLRQALSVLRRELPEELFATTRDAIHVDPGAARIDVLEFERLSGMPERAPLERAIDLYRGELLEGFHSRTDAFDDWLLAERKRLKERAIAAIGKVLEMQRTAADLKGATQSAMRMVSLDPLHEGAHCLLMQLYAEQGRLGDALDQYENCRQVLERELGHGPSAATTELLAELRSRRAPRAAPSRVLEPETVTQLRVVAVLAVSKHDGDSAADHAEGVAHAVHEHDGQLLRRTTSSMLAVFGVVRSQGSEAVRALAAAQQVLALAPGASAGVSLAQVVVTRTDGTPTVMGEAVSQALHLASVVEAGDIAVSESVRQALNTTTFAHGVTPLPQRDADGKVSGWVLGRDAGGSEQAARTPFVGRARELAVLRTTLHACKQSQLGQLIRIRGEAGIGKTRLLEELVALAEREGFRIHRAAALDFGRRNERDVVAQLTRGLLLRRAAASADANGPASSRDHGLLLGLANLDDHPSPEAADQSVREARAARQRELWLELWQREIAEGPTLVGVEDLHWADEVAFDQLAALQNLTATGPLLMVVTSRRELTAESSRWRGALRSSTVLSLDLGPLSGTESRQLAETLSVTDEARVSEAVQRSGGHPLFLEQILRTERPVHLTPSIHVVVQTRVDQLAPREAAALRAAAVLGQRFELSGLRELVDGDVPTEALLRSGLIRQVSGKFMFSHAMIRDAVYETLPPAARRALHAKAAEVVKPTDLALAAEHLERATDPSAATVYLKAAEAADRRDRVSEALKLAERGLALASEPELSFTLMTTRVRLLQRLGQRDAAEQTARDALAVATTDKQVARAWVSLAECLRGTPRDAEALSALDAAESATRSDDHDALSHIHYLRGSVLFPRARAQECLAAHLRALSHSQQARSPRAEARALSGLGDAYYIQGDIGRAKAHFEACTTLADEHGLTQLARVNRTMAELCQLFSLDRVPSTLRSLMAYAAQAREELDLHAESVARSSAIFVQRMSEAPSELDSLARQTVEAARRSGRTRLGLLARATVVQARVALGQTEGADRDLDTIYESCSGADAPFAALNVLGVMLACCRDPGRRRMLYEEAARVLEHSPQVSHCLYTFSCDVFSDCLDHGDHERLEEHALRLEAYTRPTEVAWGSFFCAWARELSAWQQGNKSQAQKAKLLELARRARGHGFQKHAERIEATLAS